MEEGAVNQGGDNKMTPLPDHELDAIVATKVMGWTREGNEWAGSEHEPNATRYLVSGPGETHPLFWSPTRDMNHAVRVMDKASVALWPWNEGGKLGWSATANEDHDTWYLDTNMDEVAERPGSAVCLAAVKYYPDAEFQVDRRPIQAKDVNVEYATEELA